MDGPLLSKITLTGYFKLYVDLSCIVTPKRAKKNTKSTAMPFSGGRKGYPNMGRTRTLHTERSYLCLNLDLSCCEATTELLC